MRLNQIVIVKYQMENVLKKGEVMNILMTIQYATFLMILIHKKQNVKKEINIVQNIMIKRNAMELRKEQIINVAI